MPALTTADLRAYLRIETDAEDVLLGTLLRQATAVVEAYLRQPIQARPVTFTLAAEYDGHDGRYGYAIYASRLRFPLSPIAEPVTVTDRNDETLVDYTVSPGRGTVTAASGASFAAGPYTVTATAGLSLRPDFTDAVEPAINAAITDVVADVYQRRNPGATYEGAGGGVSATYSDIGLPQRIKAVLAPWRRVLV